MKQQLLATIWIVNLLCAAIAVAGVIPTRPSSAMNPMGIRLSADASFICKNKDERLGYSISGAGDVNGDGYDDFMIAAYHNYVHGWNSGGVYLLLGQANQAWGFNVNIEQAASAIFRGTDPYDLVGYNVSGRGDFNGDGLDDLLIGAPGHWDRIPTNPGWLYIVFGRKSTDWGKDLLLASEANVKIVGEKDLDQFGYAVDFVGDLNHDGFDDVICSAAYRNEFGKWDGKAYLILGDSVGWHQTDRIAQKAVASFMVYRYDEALVGYSVAGVGDVNRDGTPDFVIGVPGLNRACLILGRPQVDWGQNFNLENADYVFTGEYDGDYAGSYISYANDVDRDGYADFLISAIKSHSEGGRVYLITGRPGWEQREVWLGYVPSSFNSEDVDTHTGFSTSGLVDYDGDGYDDFLIGARYLNSLEFPHAGKLYLIRGKASGWQHDLNLEFADYYFWGDTSITCAGWQVEDVGDVNGDCAHDFVTSGPFNSTGNHWGGKIYFFYGQKRYYPVNGQVIYFMQQRPVPDVKLMVTGSETRQIFTDHEGKYRLLLAPHRDYWITPSKILALMQNHLFISAYDAALVARQVVGLGALSRSAGIAADVDEDQKIAMYDAAQIGRYAVDLPRLAGSHVGEFRFEPNQRSYPNLSRLFPDENYTTVILGDVNGDWQATPLYRELAEQSDRILPGKLSGFLGMELAIPLSIESESDVVAVDIHVQYEPDQLQFKDFKFDDRMQGFDVVANTETAGIIKIAAYGPKAVDLSGELMRMTFRVLPIKKRNVSNFEVTTLHFNEGPILSDRVRIFILDKKHPLVEADMVIQPNPFNPHTHIYFESAQSGVADLAIYDMLGREVRRFSLGEITAGKHVQFWDGRDNLGEEVASGIYFVKFNCGEQIQLTKLIKLK